MICLAVGFAAAPTRPLADTSEQLEMGNRLASVLRAGRSVVSNSQSLINDPKIANKGLTGDVFFEQVIETYLDQNCQSPLDETITDFERTLTETQLQVRLRHVLRSPINAIIGYLEMIFEDFEDDLVPSAVRDNDFHLARSPPAGRPDRRRCRRCRAGTNRDRHLPACRNCGGARAILVAPEHGSDRADGAYSGH